MSDVSLRNAFGLKPKIGPPEAKVHIMYPDKGVMRFLRSAGGPVKFGPASKGGVVKDFKFVFRRSLDPDYLPGTPLYLVIWRYYDDGRVFQQVSYDPIRFDSAIWDGFDVNIDMNVRLDKRQWLS